MHFPMSTGEAARVLGTTEPILAEAVRRGRVVPPPVVAGRRLWSPEALLEAAEALGLATDELRAAVASSVEATAADSNGTGGRP